MNSVVPRFPRGFVLSTAPVEVPDVFEPGPFLPNFFVHPWARVDTSGDADQFVIVIGTCVPVMGTDDHPAATLLAHLRDDESTLLAALSDYAGRYAVIFGSSDAPKILADATAMRSLFYAETGKIVASHAQLVENALGGEAERRDLPFRGGFPGNRIPLPRTRILIANTYYALATHTIHRFWPTRRIADTTVEHAAMSALEASSTALRNISAQLPVKVALTAGLDSRVLLAIAIHSGVEFETYTYGRAKDTLMDRNLAADLARHMGVKHTVTPPVDLTVELRDSIMESFYARHHRTAVAPLREWFGPEPAVAVTANLLEIARSFYAPARRQGLAAPVTAEQMVELYYWFSMGGGGRKEAEEYGRPQFYAGAAAAFQEMIDAGAGPTPEYMDPFDQSYWEHRMTVWHGAAMVERDFYAEAFIPFNARSIFETLLGVPRAERDTAAALYRLIELVDPRLLDFPVNPKEWPPAP